MAELELLHREDDFPILRPIWRLAPSLVRDAQPETIRFRANETIWKAGDLPDRILILKSGWACRFRRLQEGSHQVLRFLIPGDTTPLISLARPEQPLAFWVRTITDVTAASFDRESFLRFMRESEEQNHAILGDICDQLTDMEHRLTDLGLRSAPSRAAQLLLDLEARLRARGLSTDGAFDFPVRQEDFARALGLTLVHANRTLVQLRRTGCIDYSRGVMTLLDIPALERIAADVTALLAR